MILFVRDLTVIDFSYLSLQRGMIGESYIVDVELQGELNETSMVFDFGKVKKLIKQAIDQLADHKLALPLQNNALTVTTKDDIQLVYFNSERGLIQVAAPAEAFVNITVDEINGQNLAVFLAQKIQPLLPDNVTKLTFTLRTEQSSGFYYHYSHGLKKHDGNCQRIAHGHRSTIQIYSNGMLSPRLNKYWAERWQDIYLGSQEDSCDASQLQYLQATDNEQCFRYQAAQGSFELSLPVAHCELVPCDTTVECLADYIASELKQQDNSKEYKVVAYEGVGKGAVAVR